MTNIRRALEAAAGTGSDPLYVEDVFSNYLYTGTGATLAINNGIDLSGEGGMVWIKNRTNTNGHRLIDTERGVLKVLESYDDTAEATESGSLTAFNSNGFTVGDSVHTNESCDPTVSWTFRKAPGFFDVVTYTGNSTAGRTISHSLGSVPGCIIVKKTSATEAWGVYHRSASADPEDGYLRLNDTDAYADNAGYWHDTAPTSTEFTLGGNPVVNTDTETYVAYLFANDDQSFGEDSDESIIKCGGFTTSASYGNYKVDLGWEPQFVLMKDAGDTGDWFLLDSMRGIVGPGEGTLADTSAFYNLYQTSDDAELKANTSAAESDQGKASLYGTGFMGAIGFGNRDFVYIAIRRPMKVPEAGTEIFLPQSTNTTSSCFLGPKWTSSFPVDMIIWKENITAAGAMKSGARLTQGSYGLTNDTTVWASQAAMAFDYSLSSQGSYGWREDYGIDANEFSWMFGRASKCMDVICWAGLGNSAGPRTVNHNLGVKPELFITKCRDQVYNWYTTYGTFDDQHLMLDLTNAISTYDVWGGDATATTVTVENDTVNELNKSFIGYLFATLADVSKVGTYTADGTLTTIDCGFSTGARFILIKRVNDTGDWYMYDSVRGIVAGNDPYIRPNQALAQVTGTDYIDPDNSGFQLTAAGSGTINIDTGQYIFLAIA